MQAVVELFGRETYVGHWSGIKTVDLEVFQHTGHSGGLSHRMYGAADGIIAPLHQIDESLVHHHLAVIARQSAFFQFHAHQVVVVAHAGVEAGGEQAFAVFSGDETAAIAFQRIAVSGGEVFDIRQTAEKAVGVVALLGRFKGQIGAYNALGAEAHVLAHDEVVLHHHHAHQSADESHTSKLHEQQRTFPPLLAFGVAAEHLSHRNAGKQPPRQYATHQQQQGNRSSRYPQTTSGEEVGQLGGGCIFYKVAEAPQQEEHHHQRQNHYH